ncbi:MAG: THUMP domain-containing protein [Melioribacteraceae bacterium]
MYEYQKDNKFFAQVPGMMETLCEEELIELGAKNTKVAYRGVYFKADSASLYRINYTSRMISRVLAPLITFHCQNTNILIKTAEKIRWEEIFNIKQTFAISASVAKSAITNSLYASQCLKDGIADYFRKVSDGLRPDVSTVNPDVRINLHIEKDEAVISLDTSGESLHKRGYRLLAGEAPMQETLAAAIIRISKWDGQNPLWDCMCGSGTILCEALMHYCRIPAQKLRTNFGFFYMPDFDKQIWEKIKAESDQKIRPLQKGLISGSDKSQRVIDVAKDNLSRLPFSDTVDVSCHPFQHVKQFENGTLITNPPYGIRMGDFEDVKKLYTELGDFIKQKCKGTTAFIYTGDPVLRKSIGLKTSRRVPLVNGKLEGVLVQIDSYEGSKKKYYAEYKAEEKLLKKKSEAD